MDSSENNARLRSSPIDRASKPDSLGPRASDDNTELDILPRAANQTLQTHWFSLLARRVEKHKFGGGAIDGQGPRGYGHSSRLAVPWGQTGDAPISMARSDLDTRARKIHRPARISNNSRGMIVPTTCEGLWRPAGARSTAGAPAIEPMGGTSRRLHWIDRGRADATCSACNLAAIVALQNNGVFATFISVKRAFLTADQGQFCEKA